MKSTHFDDVMYKLLPEFMPPKFSDDDKKIIKYHRKIRTELIDRAFDEIYKAAFVADPKQEDVYKSYFCEMSISTIFYMLLKTVDKLNIDSLKDFMPILIQLIVKSFKYVNTKSESSLRESMSLESLSYTLYEKSNELYEQIEKEFTIEDFQ